MPEEMYENPDYSDLASQFPVRILLKSPEEVVILPKADVSLRHLQEAPRFLYRFLQKNYEDNVMFHIYDILLKFLYKTPATCDSRNMNYYFNYTSQFLRAQINVLELLLKLRKIVYQTITAPNPQEMAADPNPQEMVADQEMAADPNPQEMAADPNPQEMAADPNPQEMAADPNPQEMAADPNPQEMKADPNVLEPFLAIWQLSCSSAVYSQYSLLRVLRLILQTTLVERPILRENSIIFTKKFYAYENSSYPKHLRSYAIEEFLNLSTNHAFFIPPLTKFGLPRSEEGFEVMAFLLHAVCDQYLPLKTQVQLCEKLPGLAVNIQKCSDVSDDVKSSLLHKIFQTLALKLKLVSNFERLTNRLNDNAGMDLDSSGSTLIGEKSFSFIKLLQNTDFERKYQENEAYEFEECSPVDYKNMIVVIINTIHFVHQYGNVTIGYESETEKERFLPYYSGLLKHTLRAIRMCNEENRRINEDGFEKEKIIIFEKIASIWHTLDGFRLREMLTDNIQDLLKPPLISNTVMIFFCYLLLNYKTESRIVTNFLLEYLLGKLTKLNEDSDEFITILPVYELLFKSNFTGRNNMEEIKAYVPEIILRSCKVSAHARGASGIVKIIKSIFLHFKSDLKKEIPFSEFEEQIDSVLKYWLPHVVIYEILPHLNRLYRDTYDPIMKEDILNICLFIPYGFLDYLISNFIHQLMPFVVAALASSGTLVLQGLKTLGRLLAVPLLNKKIECHREIIAERLYSALRRGSPVITSEACNVIYYLGAGNWVYGKLTPAPDKSPMIRLRYNNQESVRTEITFPIEKMISLAVRSTSKSKKNAKWQDCLTIVKYCYSALQSDSRRLEMEFEERDVGSSSNTHKLVLMALLDCSFNLGFDIFNIYIEHYTSQGIMMQIESRSAVPYLNPCDMIDAIIEFATLKREHLEPGLQYIEKIISYSESSHSREVVWDSQYILYIFNSIYSLFSIRVSLARHFACMATNIFIDRAPLQWTSQKLPDIFESLYNVYEDLEVVNTPKDIFQFTITKAEEYLLTNKSELFISDPLQSITEHLCHQLKSPNKTVKQQAWSCLTRLQIPLEFQLATLSDILTSFSQASDITSITSISDLKSQLALAEIVELVSQSVVLHNLNPDMKRKFSEFLHQCIKICKNISSIANSFEDELNPESYKTKKELYKECMKNMKILLQFQDDKLPIFKEVITAMNSTDPDVSQTAFAFMKRFTEGYDEEKLKEVLDASVNLNTFPRPECSKFRDLRYLVYLYDIFQNVLGTERERIISTVKSYMQLQLLAPRVKVNEIARKEVINSVSDFCWVSCLLPDGFNTLFQVYLRLYKDCDSKFGSDFGKFLLSYICESGSDYFGYLFETQDHLKEFQKFFTFLLKDPESNVKESSKALWRILSENNIQGHCYSKLAQPTVDYGFNSSHNLVIQIIYYVSKYNPDFLKDSHMLAQILWNTWMSSDFQSILNELEMNDHKNFKVYKWLAKSLLRYFKLNENEIKILFSLLIPLTRTVGQHFQFLTDFLHELPTLYDDNWKHSAFKCFIELFHEDSFSLDVKSKILQLVLIPSFSFSRTCSPHLVYEYIQETTKYCKHFHDSDALKVQLLQLNCVLLKYGSCIIAQDTSCCGDLCLYREMVYFSKFCIWHGNRCHNLMVKSHGNLLLMHILKYTPSLCQEKIVSRILSNLCDICPPDIQNLDLYIVQSLLKDNFARKKLNFKKWAEELFAKNLKEHALVYLLNMLTHCFEVFDFQFRDFVTDLIEVANLSDFNQRVFKENEKLIYKVLVMLLGKVKDIDEQECIDGLFSDLESKDEQVPEKEACLFLYRYNPAPCSDRILCRKKELPETKCDESKFVIDNFFNFVKYNIERVEESSGKPADEKGVMEIILDSLGFRKNENKKDEENKKNEENKKYLKSSIVELKYKMTLTLLNYLLEFASQDPGTGDKSEKILDECCSFLKSTLSSDYFNYCPDLNWWFKHNDRAFTSRAAGVESNLLLHIILEKLNLEISYKTRLEDLLKKVYYLNIKEVCVRQFECLLEIKRCLESNKTDFGKEIYEKMVLYIIHRLTHREPEPDDIEYLTGPALISQRELTSWDKCFLSGLTGVDLMFEVLLVVDFSPLSFYELNRIASEASQFDFKGIEHIPVEKIFWVLTRLFELSCFDLFADEMLYKIYLISRTTEDATLCLSYVQVLEEALTCRWRDALLANIERRGREDQVPNVYSRLPQSLSHHLMSLDYDKFISVAHLMNLCEGESPSIELDILTTQVFERSFSLCSWAGLLAFCLRVIPNETPESAFLQNMLGLDFSSNEFSRSMVSLCFHSSDFTNFVWTCMISKVWDLVRSKEDLAKVLISFLDGHLASCKQEDRNLPISLGVFTEGLLNIVPSPFDLDFHKKFGQQCCMWAKTSMLFQLEDKFSSNDVDDATFVALCDAYTLLDDHDMLEGLWKVNTPYPNILIGITLEQQGLFDDAARVFESAVAITEEAEICSNRLIKCRRELGAWPTKLEGWNAHRIIQETHCFCQSLRNRLKSIVTRVNESKTLSFVSTDCSSGKCLEEIFNSVTKFTIYEWKILPQAFSDAHVAQIQNIINIENTKDAAMFLNVLSARDEKTIFRSVNNIFKKWRSLKVSPHENSSFFHELQDHRKHICKQFELSSLNDLDMTRTLKDEILLSSKNMMVDICKQIAEANIVHGYYADYTINLFEELLDTQVISLVLKACYVEIYASDDIVKKKRLLNYASKMLNLAREANVELGTPLTSAQTRITKDLTLLREEGIDPRRLDEYSMFDSSFYLNEKLFLSSEVNDDEKLQYGNRAIECLLEGSRLKGRNHSISTVARIIFLLTVEKRLGHSVPEDKWNIIPESYWLPWISELLSVSIDNKRESVVRLIEAVGRKYPQSLYVCLQAVKSNTSGQEANAILEEISRYFGQHHPLLKNTLDNVYAQLRDFKKTKSKPELQNLIEILDELLGISYVCLKMGTNFNDMSNFWQNLRFRLHQTPNCPRYQEMESEMEYYAGNGDGISSMLIFISKWIEFHSNNFPLNTRLDSQYLRKFHHKDHNIKLLTHCFDQAYVDHFKSVKIYQFLPEVMPVKKFNDVTYRFYIKGCDGKIYPYTFLSEPFIQPIRKENNFNHFMRCLNSLLDEHREAARHLLSLKIPDIVTLSPAVHIIRDSLQSLLFNDICRESVDFDPIQRFYQSAAQSYEERGEEEPLDRNVLLTLFALPTTYFKDWVRRKFENPSEYLKFRKQFAKSLALFGQLKHTFGFTSQYPSNMLVHKDEGCITNIGYSFHYTKAGILRKLGPEEVPLRLTPNISKFLTLTGVRGIFNPAMMATAACLRKHHAVVIKLTELFLLHDVLLLQPTPNDQDNPVNREEIMRNVFDAANNIRESIFNFKELYDGSWNIETNIPSLVEQAEDLNKLCVMDPVWLPWY